MLIKQWKDIEGYENYYEISNHGNFKTKERKVYDSNNNHIRTNPSKLMKINEWRYLNIGLNKKGKQSRFNVHRLVALHFVPNPNNLPHINHKDGDKHNNRSDNLEWCTPSHNQKHAYKNGLKIAPWLGKKLPQKTLDKMSKIHTGKIPWNKGIKQKDYIK